MSDTNSTRAYYTIEWEDGVRSGHPRTQYPSKALAFAELDRMYARTEYPGSLRVVILNQDGKAVWAQHGTHIELNADESPAQAPAYREMDSRTASPVNGPENGAQALEGATHTYYGSPVIVREALTGGYVDIEFTQDMGNGIEKGRRVVVVAESVRPIIRVVSIEDTAAQPAMDAAPGEGHTAACQAHAVQCAVENGAVTLVEAARWAHGYLYEHTADGPDGTGICKCLPYMAADGARFASREDSGEASPEDVADSAEGHDNILPLGGMREWADSMVSDDANADTLQCSYCGQTVDTYRRAHDDTAHALYRFAEHTAFDHSGRADILRVHKTVVGRFEREGE